MMHFITKATPIIIIDLVSDNTYQKCLVLVKLVIQDPISHMHTPTHTQMDVLDKKPVMVGLRLW